MGYPLKMKAGNMPMGTFGGKLKCEVAHISRRRCAVETRGEAGGVWRNLLSRNPDRRERESDGLLCRAGLGGNPHDWAAWGGGCESHSHTHNNARYTEAGPDNREK